MEVFRKTPGAERKGEQILHRGLFGKQSNEHEIE
jgi:hypothetical protein